MGLNVFKSLDTRQSLGICELKNVVESSECVMPPYDGERKPILD